jgi:hypothetical protein
MSAQACLHQPSSPFTFIASHVTSLPYITWWYMCVYMCVQVCRCVCVCVHIMENTNPLSLCAHYVWWNTQSVCVCVCVHITCDGIHNPSPPINVVWARASVRQTEKGTQCNPSRVLQAQCRSWKPKVCRIIKSKGLFHRYLQQLVMANKQRSVLRYNTCASMQLMPITIIRARTHTHTHTHTLTHACVCDYVYVHTCSTFIHYVYACCMYISCMHDVYAHYLHTYCACMHDVCTFTHFVYAWCVCTLSTYILCMHAWCMYVHTFRVCMMYMHTIYIHTVHASMMFVRSHILCMHGVYAHYLHTFCAWCMYVHTFCVCMMCMHAIYIHTVYACTCTCPFTSRWLRGTP